MFSMVKKAGFIPKLFIYSSSLSNCTKQVLPVSSALSKVNHLHTSVSVANHCVRSSKDESRTLTTQRWFHSARPLYDEVRIIETPPFADSISEGDIRWEKAVGDFVQEDETVGEIETDKTAIPVPSPASGVIVEFLVEDGATIQAGQQLFKLKLADAPAQNAQAAAPASPVEKSAAVPSTPPTAAPITTGPIPTQPPPIPAPPSAPLTFKPVSDVKPIPVKQDSPTSSPSAIGVQTEHRVKMNRMRLRIAQRLKDAQNICAMLTTFNEIDMTNLIELRKKHKDEFMKKHGLKLGFMSAFVKASASALTSVPIVNAAIEETDIVYRDYVDISVAVATPKGLVVPVIRNANSMNFADIERTINELGEKARSGTLAIEDMDGGTFTISNGGVFGSMFGTPIINPPQSAILGMHAVVDRPVAVNGKVEIRPIMYVALTYDHRLIDGREAVIFLRKIKSVVEEPHILLLDL